MSFLHNHIYKLLVLILCFISCNKYIIYNKDKSCSFNKVDFKIKGNTENSNLIEIAPIWFYKRIDSLYPNYIGNWIVDYNEYDIKKVAITIPSRIGMNYGCKDSVWMAKVLRKEYEKRFGVYLKDTTLAINIYNAKILDTSKLDILPLINYTKSNMDSILKNVKSLAAIGGNYIEDETLPGNKIHYLVSRDTIGQYFEVFNAPQTLLLFSIRNQTSNKHRLGGVADYQIKDDVIQPGQTRLNLHYKLHNDIFKKQGFEAFKKYCLEHHGVEVWLDRVDTFKVKKIKFRN